MIHFAAAAELDDTAILRDAGEECGETVIIVLRPAIRRMRVAAGAGDLGAEENAADVLGEIARIVGQRKKVGGADRRDFARGREQRAGELVERRVAGYKFAQPLVIDARGGLKPRLPLMSSRSASRIVQKSTNSSRRKGHQRRAAALPLIPARSERPRLVGGEDAPDDIEVNATLEFGILAQR